jgi:IclR family mhp operon transcriptional activator
MPTYPPVQSVMRALRLLGRLNQREATTLAELNHMTRIPKPSLVRLLDTLIGLGYVRNDPTRKVYCLAAAVQELSEGFHGGPLLVEAGRMHCAGLTRKLKWSASLAVLDGAEMFICFRTIHDSPVSPFSTMLTRRRSLLTTGLGRAYLAFCPVDEREYLAAMLKTADETNLHGQDVDSMVKDIVAQSAQGYAERDPLATPDSTSTIAMPIRIDDRVMGTIGLTYFTSAIARRDLHRTLVAPLREATMAIEAAAARLIKQQRGSERATTGARQSVRKRAAQRRPALLRG